MDQNCQKMHFRSVRLDIQQDFFSRLLASFFSVKVTVDSFYSRWTIRFQESQVVFFFHRNFDKPKNPNCTISTGQS